MDLAPLDRRSFTTQMLSALSAFGLIETLVQGQLLAAAVKPIVHAWMVDLNELCQDLKGQKLKDTDFQKKLEDLYKKVNLKDLVELLDLDTLARATKLPSNGARSLIVDLSKVEGLPKRTVFGRQIFALGKGRSIVPHGHDNMCTGFIVLRGNFVGKHYDRVEDHKDHYLIRPTIDRRFEPGECSTVSDTRDNVHWFKCESEAGFIFNIHVLGYNPENKKVSARVYVDPEGEKTAGGLIVARKVSSAEAHKKYG